MNDKVYDNSILHINAHYKKQKINKKAAKQNTRRNKTFCNYIL